MPIVLSELRDAIHADPHLLAMANVGDDTGIAAALNAPIHPVVRRVSRENLLRWSAMTGALQRLQQASSEQIATPGAPSAASAARAGLAVLSSGVEWLRFDGEIETLLGLLVQANVLTELDVSSLRARATELIGYADKTWGEEVSVTQVSQALEPDRPNGMAGGLL